MSFKQLKLIFVLFLAVLLASSVLAEIVVFEKYDTKNILDGNTIKVEKTIFIKNTGTNPIIPGELHFKVYEFSGNKQIPSQIENLYADNNYNKLSSRVITENDYSDIVVDVWNPILPDFEVPVRITYDLKFNQKGLLFHEILFPVEETTIPIVSSSVKLLVSKNIFVTYAPNAKITSDEMYKTIEWQDTESELSIEYTGIPFPRMPFKISTMFWLIIIFILSGVTVYYNFLYKKK